MGLLLTKSSLMTFKIRFGTRVFFSTIFTSNHRCNIGLKLPKFQPSKATITISYTNSFYLFSYGLESVFWYFQFQMLIGISYFSDNPLKLQKISYRDPQISSIRDISLSFSKNMEICPFWCE